jgi:hypothetical protein
MNTTIPPLKTKQPSRAGLLFHESVRRNSRSGHLPAIRFGGRLRINLADFTVFEQNHRSSALIGIGAGNLNP